MLLRIPVVPEVNNSNADVVESIKNGLMGSVSSQSFHNRRNFPVYSLKEFETIQATTSSNCLMVCGSLSGAITGIHFSDQHAKRVATNSNESSVTINIFLVEYFFRFFLICADNKSSSLYVLRG
jgi:hypothetical protein